MFSVINNRFDQLLKYQIERSTKNDMHCYKANIDADRLNEELKLGKEKSLQHSTNYLAN